MVSRLCTGFWFSVKRVVFDPDYGQMGIVKCGASTFQFLSMQLLVGLCLGETVHSDCLGDGNGVSWTYDHHLTDYRHAR